MKLINATDIIPPAGHYSHAVSHNGVYHVSGILPISSKSGIDPSMDFESQCRLTMHNLSIVLAAAGSGLTDLISVSVYVVGVKHWPLFNAIYAEILQDHRPARTVVPVPELHHGFLVEISAIAVCPVETFS